MDGTGVDRLHEEFTALITILDTQNEPSLRASADDNFRRSLLLAAASHFESRMVDCVLSYVEERSNADRPLIEFVRNKAVERMYHSWFSWDAKNANAFFALFGDAFKTFMKATVARDEQLEHSIASFLEIGRDRNRLVHGDFATFTLEKTANEIYEAYKSGLQFVHVMPKLLRECPRLNSRAADDEEH